MDKRSVGCAILAGGSSVRMQKTKALLEYGGKTYLARIAQQLSGCEERILSGGSEAMAQQIGFRYVADRLPGCGPMGGIWSSLCASKAEALFVVACDMPFFTNRIFDHLVSSLGPEDTGAVCLLPNGRLQPLCAVYTKACCAHLERNLQLGRLKLLPLIEELQLRPVYIPPEIADERNFLNVNTPSDIP